MLKDESVQIALDFLERAGEVDDRHGTELLLSDAVEYLMQHGVSSRLILSNLAITAYQKYRKTQTIELHEPRKSSRLG